MAAILGSLKDALWFTHKKAPCIDSWTFQIFNKVTSSLLVLGSVIVVARQFFGEPIRCDAGTVSNYSTRGVVVAEDFFDFGTNLSLYLPLLTHLIP